MGRHRRPAFLAGARTGVPERVRAALRCDRRPGGAGAGRCLSCQEFLESRRRDPLRQQQPAPLGGHRRRGRPAADRHRARWLRPTGDPARAAAYVPGQIRMGTAWDPFGEESGDLGEQWWRALAHELAHHLFFLPDNYLGLKPHDLGVAGWPPRARPGRLPEQLHDLHLRPQLHGIPGPPPVDGAVPGHPGRADDGPHRLGDHHPLLSHVAAARHGLRGADGPAAGRDLPGAVAVALPAGDAAGQRNFDLRSQGDRVRLPTAQVYLFQTQNTAAISRTTCWWRWVRPLRVETG